MLAALGWSLCALPAAAQEALPGARLPAQRGSFSLKIDTGVAWPLSRPQSRMFEMGGGQTVKALWSLRPYLDLGPSATFVALPAERSANKGGTAWALGAGAQLKRPHHRGARTRAALAPWLDGDLQYVRTEPLNRFGFSVGAGVALPLGDARTFWLGPFVRYFQIVSGPRMGFNDNDARILSLGLSLEVGSAVQREPTRAVEATQPAVAVSCPDRDGDTIPDDIDRCPDAAGTMEDLGCPHYDKIVVKPDKLELREKLYFAWDQAILQPVSFPVLDEVVQALKDNSQFLVQIEGHTSSDGTDDHNQTLSEERARAVLDYLAAHGIASHRLVSKGFSSTVPLDTNTTAAGRERNRRVEFVVHFKILEDAHAP